MRASERADVKDVLLQVERWMGELSPAEKIGQIFMARGLGVFPDETRDLIRRGRIGNIQAKSSEDVRVELSALQAEAKIPLLVGADMETGFTGRGFGGTAMPCQLAVGAVGCEEAAATWADLASREARAYGVNMVFGPVMDAAINPASPMVNIRAFGSRIDDIVRLGASAVFGYQRQGMQVAAKHYPGAGRSPVDNHIEEVELDCHRSVFGAVELEIYRRLILRVDLSGVMSGHIRVPAVDPDAFATISPPLVDALRGIGFTGILMTDSLAMQGSKAKMSPEALLANAFLSGHDLLLGDYRIAPSRQIEWLRQALEKHPEGASRLDASVKRILLAKARLQTLCPAPPDRAAARTFSADLSRRALTLEGDPAALAAIGEDTLIVLAGPGREDETGREVGQDVALGLEAVIAQRFPDARMVALSETPGPTQVEHTLDLALQYPRVVYITYALPRSYKGTADLPAPQYALISGLRNRICPLILLGNPYAARRFPPLRAILYAYWGGGAEPSVVEALEGHAQPGGRLPVEPRDGDQGCD